MPPISILIKPVSGLCQYRCRYCFYKDVMNNREVQNAGIMTEDTLKALVRRAFAYAEYSANFAFQGGEPMLAGLEFYRKLVQFQKSGARGVSVYNSIQTNGGLITDEWAQFFKDNHFLVGLSLDGRKEIHDSYRLDHEGKGTYEHTVRAAEILKKHSVEFNILCVVNSDTAKCPTETYEAIRKYKYLQFIPCIDDFGLSERMFSPSEEEYGNFLIQTFELYKRDLENNDYVSVRTFDNYVQMMAGRRPESCSMTGRCNCYFVIEGNGDVYPCDFYVLDQWKLGNIHTDDFAHMQKSERARQFVSSSVYMHPECRGCRHYSLCRGGCRRDREPFDDRGRPGQNRYCKSFKMFFDAKSKELSEIAGRLLR